MQLTPKTLKLDARVMYPDYASFLADALSIPNPERCKASHKAATYNNWSGTATFADAVDLANAGWKHGASMVAEISSAILSKVSGCLTETTMYLDTTTQYCWDMSSAVAGVPQCGVNFSPDQDKKLVRIVVDFGASSSIDSNVLLAKAATIASLVTVLDSLNFDTEVITAVNDCDNRGDDMRRSIQCGIMLKSPGATVDLDVMAFALGHPAFRRRIHFSWMEQFYSKEVYNTYIATGSYGAPAKLVDLSGDINITNAYHNMSQWTNPDKAAAWVLDQLTLQGVTLHDQ